VIVEVKLFAVARQLAGASDVILDLPDDSTVADLRELLVKKCPKLARIMATTMIAINKQYVADDAIVSTEHEIACIPPVSGG